MVKVHNFFYDTYIIHMSDLFMMPGMHMSVELKKRIIYGHSYV